MIKEVTSLGSIDYTYDAIGRRTSMSVAGQPAVNYSYDANSRLTGVSSLNSQLGTLNFNIAYDAIGRRASLTLPNGVKTNYNYDEGSRLLEMEHLAPLGSVLEALSYSYDATGNRISMNRPSVSLPLRGDVTNTNYNEANQMLKYNASSDNIGYDENGNMTSVTNSCGTTNYSWDVRNRLIGISGFNTDCSALSASFKYDALGRRIEKSINGITKQYLYDGLDIVQEIENSAVSANYVRTLNIDEPLARIKADGTVRYYQQDALGSVIAMTDEAGAVKTQYAYDPFGSITISGEASDNPFQYTGRENDNTGLYYYRARYYSPELQRFVSEDPIRFWGGDINLYAMVKNNPLIFTDPIGFLSGSVCGAFAYGWGGRVCGGIDPCTGKYFIDIIAGVGMAASVSFSPGGGSSCSCDTGGAGGSGFFGFGFSGGGGFYKVGYGVSGSAGISISGPPVKIQYCEELKCGSTLKTGGWKFGAGFVGGVRGGFQF